MNLDLALKLVNEILTTKVNRKLRKPEIDIFSGTWKGMTYEQMAESSSYSANYLMRDVAPKFWKLLSEGLNTNVGKSNCRAVLEKLYSDPNVETKLSVKNLSFGGQSIEPQDFDEAIVFPSFFYGRNQELDTIQEWIEKKNCQLLKLWGLSGSGKTLLMAQLKKQIQEKFEVVLWRSLSAAPSLSSLIADLLASGFNILEQDEKKLLSRLMAQMQSHSCLIMLDGMEEIFQSQTLVGKYRLGYEDYDLFLKSVASNHHQSCVVITNLENSNHFSISNNTSVRNWKLSGLSVAAAKTLLEAENLTVEEAGESLISYYQGNPAMLIFSAQIIQELFNNNIQEFLAQKSLIFGEIDKLLQKSFNRLSVLETEILYWLAGESESMSLSEIQNNIPLSIYPTELIEALESLIQRALIETNQSQGRSVFVLSPMIREFVSNQFIAQIGNNFSLDNRLNSSPAKNNPIDLGNSSLKPTNLSQWLNKNFEPGWQPVELLFVASGRSPARLRSAFNLRGEQIVKRFKQIDLDSRNSVAVLLLIAISQDESPNESAFKICVQAQPNLTQQILPANLELNLIDSANTVVASIQAKTQDNYIQLPYFRGFLTEEFSLSLSLNSISYQEKFVI